MKKTICTMLVALHLSACSTMSQAPYEPGPPDPPPVERDAASGNTDWTGLKVAAGLLLLIVLIVGIGKVSNPLAGGFAIPKP
jgi:hypothetical protein